MKGRFDLVSIGEPLVGLYPVDGEPELSHNVYGGDSSNVALAAARLGLRSAFAGAIGDDPYGDGFRRLWKQRRVDTSLVTVDPDRFTGLYVISFVDGDHRFAYYRKGSAASVYRPTKVMRDAIRSARVVHVSGITQAISPHMTELTFKLMADAKDSGALISYDVNYRPNLWSPDRAGAVAERTIRKYADLVSTNLDELRTLGLATDPDRFFRLHADQVKLIAVRDGSSGATVYTAAGRHHCPAFAMEIADTVGAGDAFDAGLIFAYLKGMPDRQCVEYANAVAAITCTSLGSTKGHPDAGAVEQLLARGIDNIQD